MNHPVYNVFRHFFVIFMLMQASAGKRALMTVSAPTITIWSLARVRFVSRAHVETVSANLVVIFLKNIMCIFFKCVIKMQNLQIRTKMLVVRITK
jgi:hypothetical protein